MATGAEPSDYDKVAAPVDGVLFFAGEATNKINTATLPGAFIRY